MKEQSIQKGGCLILMGFMGAGKTTVGELLAGKLGMKLLDTDQMIELEDGRPITEIFRLEGDTAFRHMETHLLEALCGMELNAVISIGGGMPVRRVNRELMARIGKVIYLRARIDTLVGRLQGDHDRPLLQSGDLHGRIENLLNAREEIYLEAADEVIWTDDMTAAQVADRIIDTLSMS